MVTSNPDQLYINGSRQEILSHLKSAEFFDIANFPEAKFVITEIEGKTIIGDLTIKGITFPKRIERVDLSESRLGMELSGLLIFNRPDYDIYYDHPL